MSTNEELSHSLRTFADDCNANEKLRVMNRDWNRVIHIHADDTQADFTLTSNDGTVVYSDGAPSTCDLRVSANCEILTQVFYGEVSPNEPYNEGTLRVDGSEDDVLRLDFITAMLWEE